MSFSNLVDICKTIQWRKKKSHRNGVKITTLLINQLLTLPSIHPPQPQTIRRRNELVLLNHVGEIKKMYGHYVPQIIIEAQIIIEGSPSARSLHHGLSWFTTTLNRRNSVNILQILLRMLCWQFFSLFFYLFFRFFYYFKEVFGMVLTIQGKVQLALDESKENINMASAGEEASEWNMKHKRIKVKNKIKSLLPNMSGK